MFTGRKGEKTTFQFLVVVEGSSSAKHETQSKRTVNAYCSRKGVIIFSPPSSSRRWSTNATNDYHSLAIRRKEGHFAKNPMSLNSPRTTARALTRCFLNQGCFRRNEQSSGCPLKNAPTQGGPGEDREPPQQDRGQIEHKRRHRRSVFTEPAETLAGGDLQLIQRSPIEAEDLGISFSPQHDVDDYGFNLLRQRLEFCLLFLDRSANFVQLVADFERVLHGRSLAEDPNTGMRSVRLLEVRVVGPLPIPATCAHRLPPAYFDAKCLRAHDLID